MDKCMVCTATADLVLCSRDSSHTVHLPCLQLLIRATSDIQAMRCATCHSPLLTDVIDRLVKEGQIELYEDQISHKTRPKYQNPECHTPFLLPGETNHFQSSPSQNSRTRENYWGLRNLSQTCYMNSVLNCLHFLKTFSDFILRTTDIRNQLTSLLKAFFTAYGKQRVEDDLLVAICHHSDKFSIHEVNFAYRFFMSLLVHLDEGFIVPLPDDFDRESSLQSLIQYHQSSGCQELHSIFSLLFEEVLTCGKCRRHRSKFHYQRSLPLSLGVSRSPTLLTCLKEYFEEKTDSNRAMHECDFCGPQIHTSRKSILHNGSCLVIYLERQNSQKYKHARIAVPELLDLSLYGGNGGRYTLSSALRHHDWREGHGHYTCCCLSEGSWVKFDDASVAVLGESEFEEYKNAATLFFYSKVS